MEIFARLGRLVRRVEFEFGPHQFLIAAVSNRSGISRIWRRVPSQVLMTKVSALISPSRINSWMAPSVVGSVIMFARNFDQPIHGKLREHWRFDPGLLIG